MSDEKAPVVFERSDLGAYSIEEATCTNCIKGFCPARTPALCDDEEFVFCGARKNADGIVEAYSKRTGIELHIERPS